MNCQEIQNLLSAYLDGELPAGEQAAVARHLAHCEACRRELQILERLWEGLLAAPVAAPTDLAARVLAQLPRQRRRGWQHLALAASLLLGIFMGGRLGLEVSQLLNPAGEETSQVSWEGWEAVPSHSLPALLASYDLENGNGS